MHNAVYVPFKMFLKKTRWLRFNRFWNGFILKLHCVSFLFSVLFIVVNWSYFDALALEQKDACSLLLWPPFCFVFPFLFYVICQLRNQCSSPCLCCVYIQPCNYRNTLTYWPFPAHITWPEHRAFSCACILHCSHFRLLSTSHTLGQEQLSAFEYNC